MDSDAVDQAQDRGGFVHETENDRFKKKFGEWLWASVAVAVVFHFALFFFWPDMSAADMGVETEELEVVKLPPEVKIPPPPKQIAQPATPVVTEANVEEDLTLAKTTFEDNPISELPTPPTESSAGAAPHFTPMTVTPRLTNRSEIQEALREEYPPLLKDAGIEGQVLVWFYINKQGRVIKTQIKESSGHPEMDQAALDVADVMQFTPAYNRDKKVNVWIALPITFRVQ